MAIHLWVELGLPAAPVLRPSRIPLSSRITSLILRCFCPDPPEITCYSEFTSTEFRSHPMGGPPMFSSHRSRFFTALLFVACALSTRASAQVRSLETAELTRQADVVVVGKVADVRSAWNHERTRIQTTVTVAVDPDHSRGPEGSGTIAVVTPGGEVDGVGEYYSHTARFRKDEDVVVFARKDSEGRSPRDRRRAGEDGGETGRCHRCTDGRRRCIA